MSSFSIIRQIALHKNARTTPATRAEIAASKDSASVLVKRYGVIDAMAAIFAIEADRRLIAGKACERAYQAGR